MPLDVQIDRDSRTPLPMQIGYSIRELVLTGKVAPGTRLPSSRDLSTQLSVARMVVVQAYDWLLSEGYAEARHGRGTFIAEDLALPPDVPSHYAEPPRRTDIAPLSPLSVDFRPGLPALDCFPKAEWRAALGRALGSADAAIFGYGPIEGVPALLRSIAEYVSRARGLPYAPERVIVTAGAAQALNLIMRIVDKTRPVAIEDPSPVPVHNLIRMNGATLLPVPIDDAGFIVDALPSGPVAPALVYLVPCHQFPTGAVMSLQRRLQALKWAVENDSYIVEDDYDSEFRFDASPPSSLAGLDRSDRVIYVGTFSKTLVPALRLGYLIAPEHLVERLIDLKWWTDRGGPAIDQLALVDWMDSGFFDRHIYRMRKIYAERRKVMVDELEALFGGDVKICGVAAGMHLMAAFPRARNEKQITREARERRVGVYPVGPTRIKTIETDPAFVFGYGNLSAAKIRRGLRIFHASIAAS